MRRYNPKQIEPKWQKIWEETKIYQATEDKSKPKRYVLEYFPYPSGAAMHVGHVRNYTIGDVVARHGRMSGMNTLHPMGWDAFGLPAENYAIKTGISPQEAVAKNVKNFKQQLMQMGFSYDWSREVNSTDPDYYRWTQWLFLLLYKKGLAYQQESMQWWCPNDKTVLANEQVENGRCWRCGHLVEKKALKQWFFKITEYADRLDEDLVNLDWSPAIKAMQHNWIGKSRGAEIDFKVEGANLNVKVFTTRPDTIFGATFLVLAPEHEILNKLSISAEHRKAVANYVKEAERKSDIERQETEREKTGVFTGVYALNPANGQRVPIWVADYVLPGYGTGAIMAVPAHDERDWHFAKKFELPIIHVYDQENADNNGFHSGEGIMKSSGRYDGLSTSESREKITADLVEQGVAKEKVNYKLRDWLISRQRYWGAPIPIIHCPKDGIVPVPETDLPVVLPEVKSYEPSGDGRSPLANVPEFVNVSCPKCGGAAQRETDTMDGFACSSWYFLRFADPHNDKAAFSKDKAEFWLPVDDYIGGAEHAVMHLLYARFWTKVMFDEGLISFDEPFTSLRNHGMILAPDGQKMSKSKNNTIEPDNLIEQGYGADAIRLMELFIGPWDQAVNWSVEGIGGTYRFLQRVWTLALEFSDSKPSTEGHNSELEVRITRAVHKAIKKVSEDLHGLGFNTAIAALMKCVNELYKIKSEHNFSLAHDAWRDSLIALTQLMAPFAPHIAEELWEELGQSGSVHVSKWPAWDEALVSEDTATIAIQVNGKVRAEIMVAADADEDAVMAAAKENDKIATLLEGKHIKKTVYVAGRLLSLVI
jgi:leucyl-tRNA synthetase